MNIPASLQHSTHRRILAKNLFIYVGPRLSLTAANADHWLCVPPGTEYLVALGMLRIILEENLCKTLQPEHKRVLAVCSERCFS